VLSTTTPERRIAHRGTLIRLRILLRDSIQNGAFV
jgi:hypothetical protein